MSKYTDRLSNEQCFIILAVIAGLIGLPALLLAINVAEWLMGSFMMSMVGLYFVGKLAYKVFQEINPDNDDEEDQEEEYFA